MAFYQSDCQIGKAFSNDLSGVSLGTGGWNVTSGGMAFPQKGVWRVTCEHRLHFNNENAFIFCTLSNSSSAGSGNSGDGQWWQERFGSNGANGTTHNAVFLLNLGPDLSYTYNIYFQVYIPDRTMSTKYTTNDSNGVPRCTAYLIAGTTTNGFSVLEP